MLKRINTQDQDLSLVQDNVDNALTPLQSQPMVDGRLISTVSLVAAQDNLVEHGLGRTPQLFFVGNLDQDTAVWNAPSNSLFLNGAKSNKQYINLLCDVSCTIALWVT